MANPNTSQVSRPLLLQLHAHLLTTGLASAAAAAPFPSPINPALNSLIRLHSKSPTPHLAFRFFRLLPRPDRFSLTFLARSSAHLSPSAAASAHAAALRRGLAADPHVATALLHSYSTHRLTSSAEKVYADIKHPDHVARTAMLRALSASGKLAHARKLFDEMPHRDSVAWNAMLAGYSQMRLYNEALRLFDEMLAEGARVTEPTLVPVLSACAGIGALQQGRWAHRYVESNKLEMTVTLGTALVDMYFKCGNLALGMEVFRGMRERDVTTWNTIIGGMALHGRGGEAVGLFEEMCRGGVRPNDVTFLGVLMACSHGGMVAEGRRYFSLMRDVYGIEANVKHCGCMVDMLGRAGMLEEAFGFIDGMKVEPNAIVWRALLGACQLHGNVELGERANRELLKLRHDASGDYVLLSNIYASKGVWGGVEKVREMMDGRGVIKEAGCALF